MNKLFLKILLCLIQCSFLQLLATTVPSGSGLSVVGPCTIDVPGIYRLAQDITGNISIAANNVTLNLNRRTVQGSLDIQGQGQVEVMNGTISASGACAMIIGNSNDISMNGVDIIDSATGLLVVTTSCLRVDQSNFSGHTDMAFVANDINNSVIVNTNFNFNSSPCVVELNDSSDVEFIDVSLNNNLSNSSLDVIRMRRCTNCRYRRTKVNKNFADGTILVAKRIQSSRNILIEQSEYNSNAAPSGAVYGLRNESSFFTTVANSQLLNNEGMLEAIGLSSNTSQDTLIESSMGGCNVSTTSCAFGFEFIDGQREQVVNSITNQNQGQTTGKGMDFRNAFTPIVLAITANGNAGITFEGLGVDMTETLSGTVRDIFANNNTGSTSLDSFGLRVRNFVSPTTTTMFSNQAQGQEGNNFVVSPGGKPLVNFNVNNGTFNVAPSFFDNISVE